MNLFRLLRPALVLFGLLTLITGLGYPLLVTAVAQGVVPWQANGSMITRHGQAIGSERVGQAFDRPEYFWGRPSATAGHANNAFDAAARTGSSGSNLGPLSAELLRQVQERVDRLRAADPGNTQPIPVDLVTASASGLDPHISPAAALYQVPRVARARGVSPQEIQNLVYRHIEGPQWGFMGAGRVNVLQLNLDLDGGR
jgi:K+-transporting ATPase ATPase C chain